MIRTAAIALILLCVFVVTPFAHAQSFAGPIVPDCGGGPCQACHLVKLADNLLRFGIYLATVIATLILVYAGILYITSASNPSNISKAHSLFGNVILGFIIILIAWIVVATLLRVFLGQGKALPWEQLTCNVTANPGPTPSTTPPGLTVAPLAAPPGEGQLTDPQARLSIAAYNESHPDAQVLTCGDTASCPAIRDRVLYGGIDNGLLQNVLDTTSAANRGNTIVTSAANERTSASNHPSGNAIDIYGTSAFNAYVQSFPAVPGLSNTYQVGNYRYWWEPSGTANSTGDHWHISKTGR